MKKLILILAGLIPMLAYSQTYSVDWYKIAGGGGTSSGGNYTLTGTIGQADAGKLVGGNYTLDGGFLSGIYILQTLGSPLLSIQSSNTFSVISWPLDVSAGFVLQESVDLGNPTWNNSGATLSTNGNIKSVTVPANAGIKFFRLRKP